MGGNKDILTKLKRNAILQFHGIGAYTTEAAEFLSV
jgi:hypothetical protein